MSKYIDIMLNWKQIKLSKYRLGEVIYVNFDSVWTKGRICSMSYNDNCEVIYSVQCGMDAWCGLEKDIVKYKKNLK